jgi:dihydrolipoamide dehydrogenase
MSTDKSEVVVIGAGPGGYAAAFYAATYGSKVTLIEQSSVLGGVCLNRGCIPSKALLHASKLLHEAKESTVRGLYFGEPRVKLEELRAWKEGIIAKLSQGVAGLARQRGVTVVHGRALFQSPRKLRIETEQGQRYLEFDKAIIAVGSQPAMPAVFDLGNPRVMTSTEALELEEVPERLLVIGGGYIGMELGTVYAALGSKVVVAEALDSILAGADPDLVRPVAKQAEGMFQEIRLKAKVQKMATSGKQIKVIMQYQGKTLEETYDRVLVSVGRRPNADDLGLENTAIALDEKGFIKVDETQRTTEPHIYAIGDVAGGVLLAHKASKEARIAVEAMHGEPVSSRAIIIPAVVFTDPEVAWCGLTENEARQKGLKVEVARFPWSASGRAMTFDRTDGVTKLVVEPGTERILGVGICGHGAGELISEGVVLVEMGATVQDLAECIHPHPTLSETLMEAAEAFYGQATHLFTRKRAEVEG